MSADPCETGQSLRSELLDKASRLLIPWNVMLELTYRCNLHCSHCYIDYAQTDELSLEEWKEVLDQLKSAGTANLLITGGEIMVRPDLLDILAYARHAGFVISLITNCTLLTPEIVHELIGLKILDISTSLYGATAATHEAVTGVPGSFERTMEGIRLLADAGKAPCILTTLMKGNVEEISKIRDLAVHLGCRSRVDSKLVPSKTGDDYPLQHEVNIEQLLNLDPGILKVVADAIGSKGRGNPTCHAGLGIAAVSPYGDVSPCIAFPLKLGNLRELSFDSIWRLEPCAELRYLRSMRRSDLHVCQACHLKAFCDRCTGIAYLETGRMDRPSPVACRQADMRWRLTMTAEVTR